MRAIDADALKDALDYIDYGQHQYDLTMEAIESAPTINQWIPVTERLPEEDGWYNVTKNTRGAYFVMECWFGLNGGWGCNDRDTITAWTPILKPYEGSEEE